MLGLFLALFVKAFGVTSEDKSGFSRISLLEMTGTLQAHADVPGVGRDGSSDGSSDGDSSGSY